MSATANAARGAPRARGSRRTTPLGVVLGLLASVAQGPAGGQAAAPGYVFGVFPYLSAARIERLFGPLAREFALTLDRSVEVRTRSTLEGFEARLAAGEYDILFVNPFQYVRAHDRHGYLALVRNSESIRGLVIVREDSAVLDLANLRGRTLALPPERTVVSRLVRAELRAQGLFDGRAVTLFHTLSHDSCLHQVVIARASACATAPGPLRAFRETSPASFRVIAVTAPVPAAVFAAHARLPGAERQALRELLLSWNRTPGGRLLLAGIGMRALRDVDERDYDRTRDILESLGDR